MKQEQVRAYAFIVPFTTGGVTDNTPGRYSPADLETDACLRQRVVYFDFDSFVVKDEFLPGDLVPGDLLAVPGTGAYCRSMASNYNHALRPPVIAVRDGVARVVVRRETVDDLLATDMGGE